MNTNRKPLSPETIMAFPICQGGVSLTDESYMEAVAAGSVAKDADGNFWIAGFWHGAACRTMIPKLERLGETQLGDFTFEFVSYPIDRQGDVDLPKLGETL